MTSMTPLFRTGPPPDYPAFLELAEEPSGRLRQEWAASSGRSFHLRVTIRFLFDGTFVVRATGFHSAWYFYFERVAICHAVLAVRLA